MNPRRLTFIATLFLVGFVCSHLQAQDLGNESVPDFQEEFENSNLIFKGKLVDIQSNWVSGGYKLVFHVGESWKRTTEEYTTGNLEKGEVCLGRFVKGAEYLVYIRKKFNLKVFCESRTRELSLAESDLEMLGEGFPPSQSPGTQKLPIIMTLLVFGGLALVAIVVLRKKKKSNPTV